MIDIQLTDSSPKVFYNDSDKTLLIEGESYPENSFDFYKPVFQWFDNIFPELDNFNFHLKINYMNSSSVKCLLDIFSIIENAYSSGMKIQVKWFYEKDNSRALEMAEEFKEDAGFPFEIIES